MAFFATVTIGQIYYTDGNYDQALDTIQFAIDNMEKIKRANGIELPSGLSNLYALRAYILDVIENNT